jgi:uncharacterized protein YbjQ (UPF0145 family)
MSEPPPTREPLTEDEIRESLERVERGGIPLSSERRLRASGAGGGAFTSDLSVGDFALCAQLGLAPLAQVMGSSIYQVGYQSTPWPSTLGGSFMFEMETLSRAWNEVRQRALNRLAEEAGHVGADSVVGVEQRTGAHDWAENSIEYVVIGTAVRHGKGSQRATGPQGTTGAQGTAEPRSAARSHGSGPVLSELSVADYWKLVQAGIEPLGIVAWSSVFFVGASYTTQMLGGLGGGIGFTQNQELTEFTQGIYSARETVVQRMSAQATTLQASGVIGVRIAHSIGRVSIGGGRYERGGLMVTFHAIGTAIREREAAPPYAPQTTIDLLTSQRSARA